MMSENAAPEHSVYVTDSDFPVQFAVPDTSTLHYQGCKECSGGKEIYWFGNNVLCWNAAPSFGLRIFRNDTMTAKSYRNWALAEEQDPCDPSTLGIWRLYDCAYETKQECLSGNSWYRLAHYSFFKNPKGYRMKYYNGYKVSIFKDGLVVSGTLSYHCSEPVDLSAKEPWVLSWLMSIRVLSDMEWKEALRNPER
jgi:hypothetical protein